MIRHLGFLLVLIAFSTSCSNSEKTCTANSDCDSGQICDAGTKSCRALSGSECTAAANCIGASNNCVGYVAAGTGPGKCQCGSTGAICTGTDNACVSGTCQAGRLVFTSVKSYLSGAAYTPEGTSFASVSDADKLCQDAANGATPNKLNGIWMAMIASDTSSAYTRIQSRILYDHPVILNTPAGTATKVFSESLSALLTDPPLVGITFTENKTPTGQFAWTGAVNFNDVASGLNCANWSSKSANLSVNMSDPAMSPIPANWFSNGSATQLCSSASANLYCIQVDQ